MSQETEGVRINKYLSEIGHCSRRAADKLIEEGRIKVNGQAVIMGQKVISQDLIEVDEIGERIADSILAFFAEERNEAFIQRLKDVGLQFLVQEVEGATDKLAGAAIVVSGVFEKYDRTGIKKLIEQHGGKVSSSISKKTSYIVAGEKMGPSKREKAETLGVPIISEDEFLDKISG